MIDFKSVWTKAGNGADIELATVVHEGKEFTNLGSIVDKENGYVVGYCSSDMKEVGTWDGKRLGTLRIVSKWPTPTSWQSSHRYAVEATIDGEKYSGRTCGGSMIVRLRRKKSRSNR